MNEPGLGRLIKSLAGSLPQVITIYCDGGPDSDRQPRHEGCEVGVLIGFPGSDGCLDWVADPTEGTAEVSTPLAGYRLDVPLRDGRSKLICSCGLDVTIGAVLSRRYAEMLDARGLLDDRMRERGRQARRKMNLLVNSGESQLSLYQLSRIVSS